MTSLRIDKDTDAAALVGRTFSTGIGYVTVEQAVHSGAGDWISVNVRQGSGLRTGYSLSYGTTLTEIPTELPQFCAWFALCPNAATRTRSHPVLGDVPICDRCDDKIERLSAR